MTLLVRLSMPGALSFFISFGVFLTFDVMIARPSNVSRFSFFSGKVMVLECRAALFCVKARADYQYFITVSLYFFFFHFLFRIPFSLALLCISVL